jgi:hypothetical protein|tara:strand:- start:187 stop:333 length:147 start_codon:yes stop_codon:yes gene_type:complete
MHTLQYGTERQLRGVTGEIKLLIGSAVLHRIAWLTAANEMTGEWQGND